MLSYSALSIPVLSDTPQQRTVTLHRRDLFDARYQLISQTDAPGLSRVSNEPNGEIDERPSPSPIANTVGNDGPALEALAFIDNPSDLVPGVYEGGLKTWECALDLVDYLASKQCGGSSSGKRVIEGHRYYRSFAVYLN